MYTFVIFFRFYEDFKIDRETGESNLTQIYLMVSEGSPVVAVSV